jgi:hypothetical protein
VIKNSCILYRKPDFTTVRERVDALALLGAPAPAAQQRLLDEQTGGGPR